MSTYAVVKINGNQYQVSEGDEILVGKLEKEKLNTEVLLYVEDNKVKVGKPILKNVTVKIKILKDVEKGKKVSVFKYKAKSRYRRKYGFRPQYTRLLIGKINIK